MSKEYERRTRDDVKLFYLNKIDELTLENIKLKAHAVEVLAEALTYYEILVGCKYNPKSGSIAHNSEQSKAKKTAEARALLGWDNDNNDKEK